MPNHKLPHFLCDLAFSVGGKTLQMFPVPRHEGLFHIGLDKGDSECPGLFVDFDQESAFYRESCAIVYYRAGQQTTYTAWDDDEPIAYDAGSFKPWVREQLLDDIARILAWYLDECCGDNIADQRLEEYENLCSEFASLPAVILDHNSEFSAILRVLGVTHRIRSTGQVSAQDSRYMDAFVNVLSGADQSYREQLAHQTFSIALCTLQELPPVLETFLETSVKTLFQGDMNRIDEQTNDRLYTLATHIAGQHFSFRRLAHPFLLELCTEPSRCHIVSAVLGDTPDEARPYFEKGLEQSPENMSFLIAAETFYLTHGPDETLRDVRRRIQLFGARATSDDPVQTWIDRYTLLANDYQNFRPSTNTSETGPELIELENRLNQYWFSTLPSTQSLARPVVETALCRQHRFLSAGSASYVGWLRNEGRYQEVVDYMMPLADSAELCALRHKSNPHGFEAFLNNGLGAFLDSQEEEHIHQGLKLMSTLERAMQPWKSGRVDYALGCLTARAGLCKKAISYIKKAIRKGESVGRMARDPDFKSVWQNPEFLKLQDT